MHKMNGSVIYHKDGFSSVGIILSLFGATIPTNTSHQTNIYALTQHFVAIKSMYKIV